MDMKPLLLGIDVGTTHIKAVIFDEFGKELAKSVLDTPYSSNDQGWVTWDPESIWGKVAEAIRGATVELDIQPGQIVGICAASVGESGVPLDRHGQPLYPIIAWFDPRTMPQARWWDENIGKARTTAITGLPIKPMYTATKILWLLENVESMREKLATWLPVCSYVAYRFTGNYAIDYSQASRTMLFDQARACWSNELLELSGIPPKILPQAVPGGTLVGHVTPQASEQTGITAGTPVFIGGHDHVCGALAVGVITPGKVLDSCGTAESVLFPITDTSLASAICSSGFTFGHHVIKNMHYALGGVPASGGAVEWFIREFSGGRQTYEDVIRIASQSPPGAHGALFISRIRGSGPPTTDQQATGAFVRVQSHATISDFARAVIEGSCFELKLGIEALQKAAGMPIPSLIAIGGGAKNAFWISIKATVLNVPIMLPEVTEATAQGAAILAGIGAGVYRDEQDAVQKTLRMRETIMPDESLVPHYQKSFALYSEIADALYQIDRKSSGS